MIKKAILSFVRRLSGAERNFQKIQYLEEKIAMLNQLIEHNRNLASDESSRQNCAVLSAAEKNYSAIMDSLYTMISLASVSKQKTLFLPGGSQTRYEVEMNCDGKIHFQGNAIIDRPPLFLVTLPKSGTYFLGKIIEELGYANIYIHTGECGFGDYKGHDLQDQMDNYLNFTVFLPYVLQTQLLESGQYLLGHLPFSCHQVLIKKHCILTIRDLRYMFVSALRFLQKRAVYQDRTWFSQELPKESQLYEFFMESSPRDNFVMYAKDMVNWCSWKKESIVRYETIIDDSHQDFLSSIKIIARETGCSVSDCIAARQRALGQETHSYSGKPSTLEGIWSDRVEEKFKELGLDEINAALGYPRDWTPENYPSVK